MNDEAFEMERLRKRQSEQQETMRKINRERFANALKASLLKIGEPAVQKEIELIKASLLNDRAITGTTMTLNLQNIDAMIFMLAAIPQRIDMNIMTNQRYIHTCEVLYAIREYVARENAKKAEASLSTTSIDNQPKQS